MGNIYNSLSNLFNQPLHTMAKKLSYKKSNIYILENNFEALKTEFPQVWETILSCTHNKDKRTYEEYAQDLVASWVFEDTLLAWLKAYGFDIKLHGNDNEREILQNSKVSASSDYTITHNGVDVGIELVNSYTNYWTRTKKIHLRDKKYEKIVNESVVLLCVDIHSKNFRLMDFKNESIGSTHIPSHKHYGGKAAYEIDISDVKENNLTIKTLIDQLASYCSRSVMSRTAKKTPPTQATPAKPTITRP